MGGLVAVDACSNCVGVRVRPPQALALLEAEEAMVAGLQSVNHAQTSRAAGNQLSTNFVASENTKRAITNGLRTCSRCSYKQLGHGHVSCPVCGLSVPRRTLPAGGAPVTTSGHVTAHQTQSPDAAAQSPDSSAKIAASHATTRSYAASSLMRRGAGSTAGIPQIGGQRSLAGGSTSLTATSGRMAPMGEFRRQPTSSARLPQRQRQQQTLGDGGFSLRDGPMLLAPAACRTLAGVNAERLQAAAVSNSLVPIDASAALTWQFPLHPLYPERKYQLDIVRTALFSNTLVSLPTGLGKTFIAAVVMHNYRRWYPGGKIVFMAPTRPLVTQQVQACHKIVGIPESDTAQMLSSVAAERRPAIWAQRNVVYCTPHMFQNDLSAGRVKAKDVVLIVLDEAHRAVGNYAYCKAVRLLDEQHSRYRLLALSATPGTDLKRVQSVIDVLHVGAVEARADGDPDVAQFTHSRTIDRITVELSSALKHFQDAFASVLKPLVERLHRANLLSTRDPRRLSAMALLKGSSDLRADPAKYSIAPDDIPRVMDIFSVLQKLQPAMTELQMHGTFAFWRSIQTFARQSRGTPAQRTILQSGPWQQLVRELAQMEATGRHVLHPKLVKLGEKLLDHFARHARATAAAHSAADVTVVPATRVIIFTETRNSVAEIIKYLRTTPALAGVCNAAAFVGQSGSKTSSSSSSTSASSSCSSSYSSSASSSARCTDIPGAATMGRVVSSQELAAAQGQTQKQQADVVARFSSGAYNTLVATCIGEEGLDIGEVGLIVLFDSSSSPVRTVQRIGRTGRQRAGEIVALVTPGPETAKFDQAFRKYRSVSSALRSNLSRFRLSDRAAVMALPTAVLERCQLSSGESLRHSQVAGSAAASASASASGPRGRGGQDIREAMAAAQARPGDLSGSQAALLSRAFGGEDDDCGVVDLLDEEEGGGNDGGGQEDDEEIEFHDGDGPVDEHSPTANEGSPEVAAAARGNGPDGTIAPAASKPRRLPWALSQMVSRGAEAAAGTGQLAGIHGSRVHSALSRSGQQSLLGRVVSTMLRAGRSDDWIGRTMMQDAAAAIAAVEKEGFTPARSLLTDSKGTAIGAAKPVERAGSSSSMSAGSSAMRPAADIDAMSSSSEDEDFEARPSGRPTARVGGSLRSDGFRRARDDGNTGGGVLGRIYREELGSAAQPDTRALAGDEAGRDGSRASSRALAAAASDVDPLAALGASRIRTGGVIDDSGTGMGTRWARRAAEAFSAPQGAASAGLGSSSGFPHPEDNSQASDNQSVDPALAMMPLVTPSQRMRKRKSPSASKSSQPSSSAASSAASLSRAGPGQASSTASPPSGGGGGRGDGKLPEADAPLSASGHERRWRMLAAAGVDGAALIAHSLDPDPAPGSLKKATPRTSLRSGTAPGLPEPPAPPPAEGGDVLPESPVHQIRGNGGAATGARLAAAEQANTALTAPRRVTAAAVVVDSSDEDGDVAVSPPRRRRRPHGAKACRIHAQPFPSPSAQAEREAGGDSETDEGESEAEDVILPVTGLPRRPPKAIARFLEDAADHSGPDGDGGGGTDSGEDGESAVDGFEASFIDDRVHSDVSERSWTDDEQRDRVRHAGKRRRERHAATALSGDGGARGGGVARAPDASSSGLASAATAGVTEDDLLGLQRGWAPNPARMPLVAALLAEAEAAGVAPKRRRVRKGREHGHDDSSNEDTPSSGGRAGRRSHRRGGARLRPMPLTGVAAESGDSDSGRDGDGGAKNQRRRCGGLTLEERARLELEDLEVPSDENENEAGEEYGRRTPEQRTRRAHARVGRESNPAHDQVRLSGRFAGGYASCSQDSFIVDDLAASHSSESAGPSLIRQQNRVSAASAISPSLNMASLSGCEAQNTSPLAHSRLLAPVESRVLPRPASRLGDSTRQRQHGQANAASDAAAKARAALNLQLALERRRRLQAEEQLLSAPKPAAPVPAQEAISAPHSSQPPAPATDSTAVAMRVSLFSKLELFPPVKIRQIAAATVRARVRMTDLRDMMPPALVKAVPELSITDAAKLRARLRKLLPGTKPA